MSVSLHTASVFFPRTRCVSFSVFRSASFCGISFFPFLSLFLSLPLSTSLSCSRVDGRVGGRADGRTVRHFLIRVLLCYARERATVFPSRAHKRRLFEAATRACEISWLRRASRAAHRISRRIVQTRIIFLCALFSLRRVHGVPFSLARSFVSLPPGGRIPFTISRFLRPSPSRHSALRLSEERRKNSSGRWPPPASHRFIPLSHGALFPDEPPRFTRGYRGVTTHRVVNCGTKTRRLLR